MTIHTAYLLHSYEDDPACVSKQKKNKNKNKLVVFVQVKSSKGWVYTEINTTTLHTSRLGKLKEP